MRHPYFTTHAVDQREDAREAIQIEITAFIQKATSNRQALVGRRILSVA